MSSDTSIGIDPRLERFECLQSDDDLKTDLELTCVDCGEHICNVERGDGLGVLARTALDHAESCPGWAVTHRATPKTEPREQPPSLMVQFMDAYIGGGPLPEPEDW